jgi:hypothetical protein
MGQASGPSGSAGGWQEGRLASLFMQIHETRGITAAWGNSQLDVHKCAKQWEQIRLEDGAVTIAPEYAHKLAMTPYTVAAEQGQFLPPEFYVLWGIYQDGMKVPLPYTPDFSGYDPPGAGRRLPNDRQKRDALRR